MKFLFRGAEGRVRTFHFLTFAGVRVVGGFIALRKSLALEAVVRDTAFVSSILLLYALGIYLFAGVIAFTTKRMTRSSDGFCPNRNVSMRFMSSVSDEWLR